MDRHEAAVEYAKEARLSGRSLQVRTALLIGRRHFVLNVISYSRVAPLAFYGGWAPLCVPHVRACVERFATWLLLRLIHRFRSSLLGATMISGCAYRRNSVLLCIHNAFVLLVSFVGWRIRGDAR